MSIKRILILAPAVLIIVLLQSYFWVPTYEQQARGNPQRLNEYITASIGDASILNPILSADSASSNIEGMVFEGLIDRDEELRFRGRLATAWQIFEEAYFYVDETYHLPGIGPADPQALIRIIKKAKESRDSFSPGLKATLENIEKISVIPGRQFETSIPIKAPQEKTPIQFYIVAPPRIKLTLKQVDQDVFHNLSQILGNDYFKSFQSENYIKTDRQIEPGLLKKSAGQILPATEHNPVLVFHLRPDIRFHDGHILDADDVRFTYQAIMNPKNLSPRIADYEPVKSVEVIDPLTVRIVYKRLYSPAIGTWAMPILPEHLLNETALEKEALQTCTPRSSTSSF